MTAMEKARETARKIREESEAEKERVQLEKQEAEKGMAEQKDLKEQKQEESALMLQELSEFANLGMKGITAEDVRPPIMFLVQNIKNKSELRDAGGTECPDGMLFLKGFNEILESVQAYFVYVKKDHYKTKETENQIWDGSRMYRTIAVRKSDMMPFALNLTKSSLNAISDLITAAKSKNLPMFAFKTEIKVVPATNKQGISYFKIAIQVLGLEEDKSIVMKLLNMAKGFNSQDLTIDEDDEPAIVNEQPPASEDVPDATQPPEYTSSEDVSDDIPF